ncbi:hypothetical protein O9H85_19505 [Paenibacillus filicis]|uniref:Uncharacterized protein n=1 Tax=Paenibacillus gyeongsangnamensis TaxID=3388067 RepID=A0ABT4QCE6_9BACL|nr:hypothetical protein [Paenibacillus filicis]MCZ8514569.1 hypothetical protein [Paenibacillus filicis]
MYYILSYKGKTLGQPMNRDKAESKLKQLSLCMNNLEIVAYEPKQHIQSTLQKQIG